MGSLHYHCTCMLTTIILLLIVIGFYLVLVQKILNTLHKISNSCSGGFREGKGGANAPPFGG